ncbi:MAG TPA: hypothetical protein VJ957_10395 [Longimicrobiales bacterium]|nr:hypothetical protein [Longimicrobiales bacterium]
MRASTQREGFVLVATLFVLVFTAALVTGSFMTANHEDAMSRSLSTGTEALFIAETGLQNVLGTTKTGDFMAFYDSTASGVVFPSDTTLPDSTVQIAGEVVGTYAITMTWVNPRLVLIQSRGRLANRGRDNVATRTVAAVVRIRRAKFPADAALSIFGGLKAGGNSRIDGSDQYSTPGCEPGDSMPGVVAKDGSLVTGVDNIYGSPPVSSDASLDTAKLMSLGNVTVNELAASADITLPGATYNGMQPQVADSVCVPGNMNWGAPQDSTSPCWERMPVIHFTGNTLLSTGVGHGILIVDGNLKLTGNMEFYGIVIVRGTLSTTGTGNHIVGTAIVAGSGDLDSTSTTVGNSVIQYSHCRAKSPLDNVLRPVPLAHRGWVDLSAMSPVPTDW